MCPRIFALARLQSVGFPQSRSFLYLRVLLDFQVQWLGPRNQQGAVCVMSGQPSQGASAVLKGAPLAPLRFLHAHPCLVESSCIEREWSRPTIQRLLESRQPGQDYRIPTSRRSVSEYASRYTTG